MDIAWQMTLNLEDLDPPHDDEVTLLVAEALAHLRNGDRAAALWRLTDAAGLLSEETQAPLGLAQPTGRGYCITSNRQLSSVIGEGRQPSSFEGSLTAAD